MRYFYNSSNRNFSSLRRLFFLTIFVFNASLLLHAQTVRNVKAIIRDGKVEVRYDLIAPDKNYEFNVELFGKEITLGDYQLHGK